MGAVQMPECHLSVITTGATNAGGSGLDYPEKACALGPVGVIPREFPGVTASLLDIEAPQSAPRGGRRRKAPAPAPDLARRLLEDLLATPANAIAAYRGDRRLMQVLRPAPLEPAAQGAPVWQSGGLYMITGGFGGIGLSIARDMAARAGAHVVLLSRSRLPERALWDQQTGRSARRISAIREIEALGGTVTTLVADVTDLVQMQKVAQTLGRMGKLSGIIHAAGVIDDAPILAKNAGTVQAVLAPKIAGLRVLDTVFPDGAADLLVLFSSTSTITTPAGQVDYVAANAYLDAVAQARQGGKTRVLAVNWGVWADTGMAADAMARRMGDTGDDAYPLAQPMLRSVSGDDGDQTFGLTLSARDDWVLDGHRLKNGQALLPGTAVIELVAEAMAAGGAFRPFELRDLYFLRPFDVAEGVAQSGQLRLRGTGDNQTLSLHRAAEAGGHSGWLRTAEARLHPLAAPAPRIDPAQIAARCGDAACAPYLSPQEAHLTFGARWHVVQSAAMTGAEGLATLALPDAFRGDLAAGYLAHPALLDLATGWAVALHAGYDPADLWVPAGYAALRVYRPLPGEIISRVRLAPGADAGTAVFDITLATPDGAVLLMAEGFRMRRLDRSALAGIGAPPAPGDIVPDMAEAPAPLSAAEARLLRHIAQGITAKEGAEALRRALASGAPQMAISPLDLNALKAEAAAAPDAAPSGQSFERPQLDGDYVPPEGATETALADIWSSLLGIAEVGAEDSFFDLGGHSLLAVRLFAQVRQRFGVDFPLSLLFEAPSIRALAQRIEAQAGPIAPDVATDSSAAADQPAAPRHLVPLHPDMSGPRTPFFIVAGMFGNVLNLRQLALLVGQGRPVWGLQARGLIGDSAPHETMEAAAADYIAEIRGVQPEGPYYLGGFSGGGLIAYEMAQQLRAAGQEVGVLALLDTPLPVRPSLTRADKALIKLHELRRNGPRYLLDWARDRAAWELSKRRGTAGAAQDSASFNNAAVEAAFRRAAAAYTPRRWDGPITLLRPKLDRHWQVTGGNWVSAAREYVFDDNQWTRHAPGIDVIEVPGDHDGMVLVPNVGVLAGHLNAILTAADLSAAGGDRSAWAAQSAAE